MAEYIEREAVKAAIKKQLGTMDLFESRFNAVIDAVPAADVAPVILPEHYCVIAGRHENGKFYSDLTGEEVANILNAYASGMLKPVVHGRWIGRYDHAVKVGWKCSICGCLIFHERDKSNYCPNCGARMDGE